MYCLNLPFHSFEPFPHVAEGYQGQELSTSPEHSEVVPQPTSSKADKPNLPTSPHRQFLPALSPALLPFSEHFLGLPYPS